MSPMVAMLGFLVGGAVHGQGIEFSDTVPKREDIKAIVAEVHQEMFGAPDLPPFVVKSSFHTQILSFFDAAVVDENPNLEYLEVGSLKIVDINNEMTRISWYSRNGKGALPFSAKGVRFFNSKVRPGEDEAMSLDRIIRVAFKDSCGVETRHMGHRKFDVSLYDRLTNLVPSLFLQESQNVVEGEASSESD